MIGSWTRATLGIAAIAAASGCGAPPAPALPKAEEKPIAAVRVQGEGIDGRAWLAPDAARAAAAGAGSLQVLGADVASEGDRIGAFVEIPEAECLLAFARPSPTILDVDLFAYDDDGSAFATDESPEAQAAVMICPPHPRRLYVAARVMGGSGILSVGVQGVPRAAADAVAKAIDARGRPGEDTGRLDAWPGLEARIRAHRAALGSRWEDVRRVALPVGPRVPTRVSVNLEPGRCTDVLVTPADEVSSLEVVAEDSAARIVARGRDHGRDRSLVLCASTPAVVSIALRARGSQGLVALTVSRTAVGAEPEISEAARVVHVTQTLDLEGARKAIERSLSGRAYDPPRAIANGKALVGSRVTVPIDLPKGCARIDVIAGKPLADVTAALWDDKGALLAESRGGASAALFPCGPGGKARVDVEALESPGPFAVELRRDRAAPPLLLSRPVAAGRLLSRMSAGDDAADAALAAGATAVTLDSASMRVVPVPVAAGTCVEVIAALDAGGVGLDMRLLDGAGQSTLTRSRYVTAGRICAAPGARPGSVELRLASGKADALVLSRIIASP